MALRQSGDYHCDNDEIQDMSETDENERKQNKTTNRKPCAWLFM